MYKNKLFKLESLSTLIYFGLTFSTKHNIILYVIIRYKPNKLRIKNVIERGI